MAFSSLSPRLLSVVLMLPFTFGVLRQLTKPAHWFKDFDAPMCAGQAVFAGLSPYAGGSNCVAGQPTGFVYTPIAGKVFAQLQHMFGLTFEIALCGGLICLVIYGIFVRLFRDDGHLASRAPLMTGLSASALTSGNISIGIHGLIFLASRLLCRQPVLLIPLVVAAAIIKPTFVVYLPLFLFTARSFRQRLILAGIAGSMIASFFIYFFVADGANFAIWAQVMHNVGLAAERGLGFMGLPGINTLGDPKLLTILYVGFAALIVLSGLMIAETCLTDQRARFALGISVCVLLYPRLMAYDEYTLPFGMAMALGSCERIGRWPCRRVVAMLAPVSLILAVTGGELGGRLMFDVVCMLLVGMAGTLMVERLDSLDGLLGERDMRPVPDIAS